MQMRLSHSSIWAALLPIYGVLADDGAAPTFAGLQFIFYNGSLSGSFVHPHDEQSECGDHGAYYFSDLVNTSLRIGAMPPWDRNPFFFEFSRLVTDDTVNEWSDWTSYAPIFDYCSNFWSGQWHGWQGGVYNMGFASTRYACRDEACGIPMALSSWGHVGDPYLNLSRASVERVTDGALSEEDDGPYYAVTGDESTWINSNHSCDWRLEFRRPENYTGRVPYGCVDYVQFFWKDWTVFSYALNFTNSTARALFAVNDPARGNLTLSFSGARVDGDDEALAPVNGRGGFSSVSLANPAEYPMPQFLFTNGSTFDWQQGDGGRWLARAGPVLARETEENEDESAAAGLYSSFIAVLGVIGALVFV
ncbi:hypothetical protein B0I35DRAFT_485170 [Stachybotrys elegans]|uniref:Uncharacterized protein n=1 Tax=Stachybotrys elegans TaxID=80388 RepID=A0A8K0SD40_9HYPO|nr:hypothetical protein B0I35DRAFT_485170 [Stachybotrys elegans]